MLAPNHLNVHNGVLFNAQINWMNDTEFYLFLQELIQHKTRKQITTALSESILCGTNGMNLSNFTAQYCNERRIVAKDADETSRFSHEKPLDTIPTDLLKKVVKVLDTKTVSRLETTNRNMYLTINAPLSLCNYVSLVNHQDGVRDHGIDLDKYGFLHILEFMPNGFIYAFQLKASWINEVSLV